MLPNLKEVKKVVGTKQAKRAIINNEVEKMVIAKDADTKLINELVQLCNERSIEVIYVDNMKDLGKACGIDVSAASAAILK
ncbi:ribosomal L7Ae/L30e/S12e/Gadd45 family protein [Brassicibacter mesophilus]|uniref:ribosomal L7Ae/L30e/S12e/Gadd45 family protein n=1 Tax=Brassicibacter mesophilus TaxID=745119 RepID=UPI003D199C83